MKKIVKNKRILISVLLFLVTFILMSAFKNNPNFTDEADNMLAAMKIANGGKIYLDYYAHHMPFVYYMLAPFALMGVSSTYTYRLCFYGILSLIWAFMYYRYSKKIDFKILILYPLIYICFMSIDLNYSIISEHIQAQALAILLIELFLFSKNKTLTLSSEIVIASCIFISIFSVFSSIVSVGILALIVLFIELKEYFKKKNTSDKKLLKFIIYLFKKYYRLFILIATPFVLFLIYYALNGSLKEFYRQAFYFNTHVYSNYQSYPSNPILIILYTISNYLIILKNCILALFSSATFEQILYMLLFAGTFFYLVKSKLQYKYLLFLFVLFCGNREFEGFHALSYYACAIILMLFGLCECKRPYYLIVFIIFFTLYAPNLKRLSEPLLDVNVITDSSDFVTVKRITEKENDVYYLNLMLENYINTDRLPATRAMTIFPWFQDMFEEELLTDLEKNKPRIIAYTPTDNVWGYTYQDYLELIDPYIKENYTYTKKIQIGYNTDVWVRNDYVEEVEKTLNINIPEYTNDYGNIIAFPTMKSIKSNIQFENENLDVIELKFNTNEQLNFSNIRVVLTEDNGFEIFSQTISASEVKDGKFYPFHINKKVVPSKNYSLEIINEDVFDYNSIGIYGVTLKDDVNDNYVVLNNQKSLYELNMNVYYK